MEESSAIMQLQNLCRRFAFWSEGMPILGVLEVLISIKTTRRIYLWSVELFALSAILLQSKISRCSRDKRMPLMPLLISLFYPSSMLVNNCWVLQSLNAIANYSLTLGFQSCLLLPHFFKKLYIYIYNYAYNLSVYVRLQNNYPDVKS